MKVFTSLLLIFIGMLPCLQAQMKVMDQSVYSDWKTIKSEAISNNGRWVKYHLTPGAGDNTLIVYDVQSRKDVRFERVKQSSFSEDSKHLVFTIGAAKDTLDHKKRRKVDKKDLPGDSLVIVNLTDNSKISIPDVKGFKMPSKWSGIVACQAEISISAIDSSKKDLREEGFFIAHLESGKIDTLQKVDGYEVADEGASIVYHRNGQDSSRVAGVFLYEVDKMATTSLIEKEGQYKQLTIDGKGRQVSFVADLDTTKRRVRPYELYFWSNDSLKQIVGARQKLTSNEYFISEHTKPTFSKDGRQLYFGIGELPVMADSLSLEEELVQVEVWTTHDPMLYTMQEVRKDDLVKETFQVLYDIEEERFLPLESESRRDLTKSNEGNGPYYIVSDNEDYMKALTWEGRTAADVYLLNSMDLTKEHLIQEKLYGNVSFSPGGNYAYWFDQDDLNWYAFDLSSKTKVNLSKDIPSSVVDELHDSPSKPRAYGAGGWLEGDVAMLIYDRFDIWKVDPKGLLAPKNLSKGRSSRMQVRVIDLEPENEFVIPETMVYLFDEGTKESGYGTLDVVNGGTKEIIIEPFSYRRRPLKAKYADKIVYSKESFDLFPDLIIADSDLSNSRTISHANPQQSEYRWGTIEIFTWTDFKGEQVEGLLVKPEGFDPSKKYPVIVNFYERSSDGLYRHRAPEPHRSTINYSYYANKGYVIFNPDVAYEIGDPGASAYNAVVSGVEALSKNQYVDQTRIGVQGHSWGGYQIAHLLNKTDVFKCAESGAPVVNMVSAYGGIRWGSGMSRMFQYEKTQSRLGKTLWEDPETYLRNSPIFDLDKTNTPVLILHNDNDSAVPWYQGIEYYMALRRLGKPAWFLNYNGEPHWPLKWHNRLDFNKRMEQFFAHYLLDQPMPKWMKNGVGIKDKGINQGFEIEE